jgi:hypothetical protein
VELLVLQVLAVLREVQGLQVQVGLLEHQVVLEHQVHQVIAEHQGLQVLVELQVHQELAVVLEHQVHQVLVEKMVYLQDRHITSMKVKIQMLQVIKY